MPDGKNDHRPVAIRSIVYGPNPAHEGEEQQSKGNYPMTRPETIARAAEKQQFDQDEGDNRHGRRSHKYR